MRTRFKYIQRLPLPLKGEPKGPVLGVDSRALSNESATIHVLQKGVVLYIVYCSTVVYA